MQEIKRQLVSEAEYFLSVLSGRIFWDDRNNPYLHCPTQWQLSPTTNGSLTQIWLCSHVWQTGPLVLNESGQNLPASWEFPVLLVESKSSLRGPSEVWTAFATYKEHLECYSVKVTAHMGSPLLPEEPVQMALRSKVHLHLVTSRATVHHQLAAQSWTRSQRWTSLDWVKEK